MLDGRQGAGELTAMIYSYVDIFSHFPLMKIIFSLIQSGFFCFFFFQSFQVPPSPEADLASTSVSFAEQTDAVMSKLQQVEEKLNHKTQALSNLKSSGTHSTESKVSDMESLDVLKLKNDKVFQSVTECEPI